MVLTRPRVLLVYPKFGANTFWSFQEPCELQRAKSPTPPLGLLTLAALLPQHWSIRLVDCNVAALSESEIREADLVMTGGMLNQEPDALRVIRLCRANDVPVAVGGPAPTSSPENYAEADFLTLGEAEGLIDAFVAAFERGERAGRFEAPKFQADVTRSPIPRYDLLDFRNYLFVGVQYSRGCPFTCEFCDIIELYGRVPRTKTTPQMLAELDRLHALGYRGHIEFVDDNLIGNKRAVKAFLPHLVRWQEAHGYPFTLGTEASINLADDAELLGLMRAANFITVFIGIESPNEATLVATSKKQNARRSIAESVHRLYAAGMFVTAGFIVGFDSETRGIAADMVDCVTDTGIATAMVGLLTALPNTQLHRRLAREGRLFERREFTDATESDQCLGGLNFATGRPRRDILSDYRTVLDRIYDPPAYFARVRRVGLALDRPVFAAAAMPGWRRILRDLATFGRICSRMTLKRPELAGHFWRTFLLIARRNPRSLEYAVVSMVLYLHLYPFSRYLIAELERRIAAIDSGDYVEPQAMPAVARPLAAVA